MSKDIEEYVQFLENMLKFVKVFGGYDIKKLEEEINLYKTAMKDLV